MNLTKSSAERAAFDGALIGVALILSYVESLIPVSAVSLPGFKLGLANICIMFAVFFFGNTDGIIISFMRVILSNLLFGTPTSFFFALCGAILSLVFIIISKTFFKSEMGIIGISVAASALHNVGQTFAAFIIFGEIGVFAFLEWLLPLSVVTGIITGLITYLLLKRLEKVVKV